MVDKGGPEGEEEVRKAYKAAREEDNDHTQERTVDDKVSSALINRVKLISLEYIALGFKISHQFFDLLHYSCKIICLNTHITSWHYHSTG